MVIMPCVVRGGTVLRPQIQGSLQLLLWGLHHLQLCWRLFLLWGIWGYLCHVSAWHVFCTITHTRTVCQCEQGLCVLADAWEKAHMARCCSHDCSSQTWSVTALKPSLPYRLPQRRIMVLQAPPLTQFRLPQCKAVFPIISPPAAGTDLHWRQDWGLQCRSNVHKKCCFSPVQSAFPENPYCPSYHFFFYYYYF